jgi:3-oxoacyl-[acyl-carrier-protein] synthase II
MGLAVPGGPSLEKAWELWSSGKTAMASSTRLGAPIMTAEVPAFDLASELRSPKNEKFMSNSVRFALRAAKDAIAAADADLSTFDPFRVALYTGSGQTGLESAEFFDNLEIAAGGDSASDFANMGGRAARLIDRYFSLRTLSNAGLGLLSMEFGAQGPSNNFVQDDTASASAIASGAQDLRDRRCDLAIVGGYDSLLTVSSYLAYKQAGLLSGRLTHDAYRPFDRDRDGLVLGEGAGFLVLERASDARRRNAPIAGELVGVSMAAEVDGDDADTKTSFEAIAEAVRDATRGSPFDALVAHGIGTQEGDKQESRILRYLVGPDVPVTALKGLTGYIGAATAAVELIIALKAAQQRILLPIAGHASADDGCPLSLTTGSPKCLGNPVTVVVLAWSWFGRCAAMAART